MKILASDLDGTLFRDKVISDMDVNAIKKLKEKGHKFVVSTGRTLRGVNLIFNNYDLEYDYLVLYNGSVIMDSSHKILYRKYIEHKVAKEMIRDFLTDDGITLYFDDGQDTYIVEGHYAEGKEYNLAEYASRIISVEDAVNTERKYHVVAIAPRSKTVEEAEKIREKLLEKYGEYLEIFRNKFFLDINPKGCSKGTGLIEVIKRVEESLEDLYTIGDSLNDLSMFEITNNSYTFHHAEERVKEKANNYVNYVHECVEDILAVNR